MQINEPLIYFSDFFDIDAADLEEYGAFNVSLISDLRLFIDPFLLFHSKHAKYKQLHKNLIAYVNFLRDKAMKKSITEGLLTCPPSLVQG